MAGGSPPTPEGFFRDQPSRLAIYERVRSVIDSLGPFQVCVSKSQVAFWREHGFAYLWMPDMYVSGSDAEVVLSIALGRHDRSPRFKQVAHPSARRWIHHLELHRPEDVDEGVAAWLREAADRAGRRRARAGRGGRAGG